MRIKKWVDVGAEVTIEIDAQDVAQALAEAFAECEEPLHTDDPSKNWAIGYAFSLMNEFLKALTDAQIEKLSPLERRRIHDFLKDATKRFADIRRG
jgi:hypothetical protein